MQFKNCPQKKNHNFLLHRNRQTRGSINRGPVNILRWGTITYVSINFQQHNRFYDFYNESAIESFLNFVKDLFAPAAEGKECKIQAYFELKNYKWTEFVDIENTRVWLTNVFSGRFFNDFIREHFKEDILKRIIVNGSIGSSWLFERFNKLQVIVTDKSNI